MNRGRTRRSLPNPGRLIRSRSEFAHPQTHPLALTLLKDHLVHDLTHDVDTQTAGLDVLEVTTDHGVRIDLLRLILDDDLDPPNDESSGFCG